MKTRTRLALAARPFKRGPSPLGTVVKGLIAGAVGSWIQNQFFTATAKAKLVPESTRVPPEQGGKPAAEQSESSLETVASRWTEGMMKRGPLEGDRKKTAGALVHYLFGAGWGAAYALVRESVGDVSPALFGTAVWAVSDNLILPAFRLSAWPQKYKAKEHAYAINAHLVYGWGTAAAYGVLRELGVTPLAAIPALLAIRAQLWLRKTPPGRLAAKRAPLQRRFFWQAADRAFAQ